MKIFLAGATGAIGKPLIRELREQGHEVIGTTRSDAKAADLRALGAKPVILDALDRDAVIAAVAHAKPDAIVHQLTALSNVDFRHFEKSFELTNRLRTEGTDNLLAAARAAGIKCFVAQSYAGHPYARTGGPVKTEDDPLDPAPAAQMRSTIDAIKYLERSVLDAGGIVLRYGGFYGPGTGLPSTVCTISLSPARWRSASLRTLSSSCTSPSWVMRTVCTCASGLAASARRSAFIGAVLVAAVTSAALWSGPAGHTGARGVSSAPRPPAGWGV